MWKEKVDHKHRNYRKVNYHCHFAGKYRGATHCICNLRHNVLNEIPMILHNESNYDSHLMVKIWYNLMVNNCLGYNTKKYVRPIWK